MNDLVSIVMPSYNTGENIAESIDSVIAQTYQNWELIIVDDCSTDNTDKILEKYSTDDRIIVFKNDKNSGAAVSRNKALRKARGRWIAFLDSDDLWKPEKLERQIKFMETNGYKFSYTNYEEISADGKKTGVLITGPKVVTKRKMFDFCWLGCLTAMYDKEVVGLLQIKDIKKNNDYAMWLKVCKKANCYLLSENLASYRRGRKGSVSTQSILTMITWHYKLFRYAEEESVPIAFINTCRNMIFGTIKKLKYYKKVTI